MDLEGIVLSEMSGRKKQILYVFTYMWNLKKKNKTHSKSKTDSQIQNQTNGYQRGMEEKYKISEGNLKLQPTSCKIDELWGCNV